MRHRVMGMAESVEATLRVYPNPVSDYLYVESAIQGGSLEVEVFDVHGHRVAREPGLDSIRISAALLPDGFFLARVNNESFKVLKQTGRHRSTITV